MRRWTAALLLGVGGYALNLLPVPLLPGIDLLLGDIPAFLAAIAYGPRAGAAAGALAASRTVALWGHPYGLIIFTLQAAAVGVLRHRMRPAFAVALYWLVVGLPVGVLAYVELLDVAWIPASVILLKQPLNGIVNALAAEGLLLTRAVRRLLGLGGRPTVQQYLGVLSGLATGIPLVVLWVFATQEQWSRALEHAGPELRLATATFAAQLPPEEAAAPRRREPVALSQLAALSYPGTDLYAARPDGALVMSTTPRTPSPGTGLAGDPAFRVARRLAREDGARVGVYVQPDAPRDVAVIGGYERTLIAAERVEANGGIVWAELPYQRIIASIAPETMLGELVALTALLIALGLSVALADRVERPLHALEGATRRLEAGDRTARVDPDRITTAPAEPAHLAERFNAMADRLEDVEAQHLRVLERERTARERVTTILESITDAFFALDREWRFTYVNRRAEEILRRSREELLGRSVWDEFPDAVDSPFYREYRRAVEEGRTAGFEAFYPALDAWLEVRAYPSAGGLSVFFRDISERKRTERELERTRLLLEESQRLTHVGSWEWDIRADRVWWSDEMFRIFGLEPGSVSVTFETFLERVHPDDRAFVRDRIQRAVRRNGPVEYDHRTVRPDGEVRILNCRGHVIADDSGRAIRMVGSAQDITERKEAEEGQRFLAEAGRVLASSLDYESTLRKVAKLAVPRVADWCAVYVLEENRLRPVEAAHQDPAPNEFARAVRDHGPGQPAAPPAVQEVVRTGVAERVPVVSESFLRSMAMGEEHFRALEAAGVRSAMIVPLIARGTTMGAISLIAGESGRRYDESDLAVAEELARHAALAVDNARLYREADRRAREEAALRQATEAVTASFTVEAVIQAIARNALVATGADAAVVERINLPDATVQIEASAGSRTLSVGERMAYPGSLAEFVIQTGRPVPISRIGMAEIPVSPPLARACADCTAIALPLREADTTIGVLILLREPPAEAFTGDETARANTFANLAALAFRKVQLLNEAERRREELERVMESRARLVRGFSHDLKNPLGAADGQAQLLEAEILGELSERQQDALRRVRRSIRAALDLINDLVELARAEAGQLTVERTATNPAETVSALVEEYRAQAETHGLELRGDLPDSLPVLYTDPSRVRQILGNLLSNAVKYTPEGGRIRIRAEARSGPPAPGPGRWLALDVSDTGPGIPQDQQKLLFQEFARLESATEAGVGLGLAISRSIARLLGGDITLESTVGQGSTFTLWLPLEGDPGRA